MKKILIVICLLCLTMGARSQQQDSTTVTKVFSNPEVMPKFPGGGQALRDFISEHLQWPAGYEEACVSGRVICSFVIQADGSCTDFKVVRSLGKAFDEEALRVLKLMPKWIPGMMNGIARRCKFTIPIRFGDHVIRKSQ